jgi:hypothetical protein
VSIPLLAAKFFTIIFVIIVILASAGWPQDNVVTYILNPTIDLWRIWYFWSKPKCKGAAEAEKHSTTTTTSPANIISSEPLPPLKETTPHCASQQR